MDREETVLSTSGEKMKHRILVVEDDPPSRELLGGWLEKEGFDAVLADTLEAAFMGIAAIPLPDAVLCFWTFIWAARAASRLFIGRANRSILRTC